MTCFIMGNHNDLTPATLQVVVQIGNLQGLVSLHRVVVVRGHHRSVWTASSDIFWGILVSPLRIFLDELAILSKDIDIIIIKFINNLLNSKFYIQYRYTIMSCIPPVCIFFTTIPSSRFPVSPPGGDSQDRWGDPRDCCWQRVGAV